MADSNRAEALLTNYANNLREAIRLKTLGFTTQAESYMQEAEKNRLLLLDYIRRKK